MPAALESAPVKSEAATLTLGRLLWLMLRVGATGFGGGMAVIAMMEREFVQRWAILSAEEFLNGVGLGQILGSFAVNASFFVGFRRFGLLGGLLSAGSFLLPSVGLVTGLSALYFRYHSIPAMQGAVAGLGPVVIALILEAVWSLSSKTVRGPSRIAIAVLAAAAGAFKVNTVWVLLAAGIVGFVFLSSGLPRLPTRRLAMVAALPIVAPTGLLATFLKIGFVFVGGGYVLLPMLHDHLVTRLNWLTPREFVDGVAISNLTPGPLAVLSTFAGYKLAGVTGAAVATVALLAPGILVMAVLSWGYARHRRNELAQRFLAGINPAVAGLVLSAAILLAPSALASWRGWVFTAASFLVLRTLRCHPAILLAAAAGAGALGVLP